MGAEDEKEGGKGRRVERRERMQRTMSREAATLSAACGIVSKREWWA